MLSVNRLPWPPDDRWLKFRAAPLIYSMLWLKRGSISSNFTYLWRLLSVILESRQLPR